MSGLTRWEPVTTRWNPFKDLEDMEKRLSTYLGRPAVRTEAGKEAMTVAEWSPLVDITGGRQGISHQGGSAGSEERRRQTDGPGRRDEYLRRAEVMRKRKKERSATVSSGHMGALCGASRCRKIPTAFRHPHYLEVPWDIHGSSRDYGTSSSSVVADRAVGSVRHVSDRHRRHEWNHLAAPAVRSMAGRRGVSDFQEPGSQ